MKYSLFKSGILLPVSCAILAMLLCTHSYAQQDTGDTGSLQISGIVKDMDGVPLIGATVMLKNVQGVGTSTNERGEFQLEVHKGDTLLVSILGYAEQEFRI